MRLWATITRSSLEILVVADEVVGKGRAARVVAGHFLGDMLQLPPQGRQRHQARALRVKRQRTPQLVARQNPGFSGLELILGAPRPMRVNLFQFA